MKCGPTRVRVISSLKIVLNSCDDGTESVIIRFENDTNLRKEKLQGRTGM